MKAFPKTALALYLLTLLWLLLLKFSVDIPEVLAIHIRDINMIPFAGAQDQMSEVLSNFLVFVPFGLLLDVNYKRMNIRRKLACIFIFSVSVELVQFVLAIGVTDITDVISNTLGGLFGLLLYGFSARYVTNRKLDQYIVAGGVALLALLLLLRFFVLKVRY